MSADLEDEKSVEASFPIALSFGAADRSILDETVQAIRQEYRSSIRKKRLRCRSWSHVEGREDGSIYALEVGRSVEFDWTWEGAIAYRPSLASDRSDDAEPDEERNTWCGEVVEVDETGGRIFVSISNPEQTPTTGTFFVRPFEFLALLNDIYNNPTFREIQATLSSRLPATEGGLSPRVCGTSSRGIPELQAMWEHSWGILWGPPGTGKSFSIGRQVAACLDNSPERILVVSTTNKATDGVALEIGKACQEFGNHAASDGRILRVGKGVDLKRFSALGLDGMVRGTETDLLHQVGELKVQLNRAITPEERATLRDRIRHLLRRVRDVSRHVFLASHVNVVVATAFRAMSMLSHPEYRAMIEQGRAPFSTVIIDESGLISRAVTAVLSLLAADRVLLAGDPKQLAPISRMSRVLPTSQARWLGSSGLSHLRRIDQEAEPGVHLLATQYRMHPDICEVVSRYQYGGRLETADQVRKRPYESPPLLSSRPRAVWYVLDDDKGKLSSIRADRGPGNRSWIRKKSRELLDKLFSDGQLRCSDGLFLSPFVAQAKDIASYLAERDLATWSASTIHSQQGAEADVVIFDTVNASSTSWPLQEWVRLVNVGLSRAREHVILLASRAEMQSPFLRPLIDQLCPSILSRIGSDKTDLSMNELVEVVRQGRMRELDDRNLMRLLRNAEKAFNDAVMQNDEVSIGVATAMTRIMMTCKSEVAKRETKGLEIKVFKNLHFFTKTLPPTRIGSDKTDLSMNELVEVVRQGRIRELDDRNLMRLLRNAERAFNDAVAKNDDISIGIASAMTRIMMTCKSEVAKRETMWIAATPVKNYRVFSVKVPAWMRDDKAIKALLIDEDGNTVKAENRETFNVEHPSYEMDPERKGSRIEHGESNSWRWKDVPPVWTAEVTDLIPDRPETLGSQIIQRKRMRPVLSAEQQRLCGYQMDGKPRLVRGVAGSGKTVVLAHWLRQTLDRTQDNPNAKLWAVFANQSLERLLIDSIEAAWSENGRREPFPWDRVELHHIRSLLDKLLIEVGLSMAKYKFDYNQASSDYLERMSGRPILHRCQGLFLDEGQDLGPNTIRLLNQLVEMTDEKEPKKRSIHIFYDNAQNLYGRGTPKWADLEIDMKGRSTIMRESFRSTQPITELAFNVLHRLIPDESGSDDHKELKKQGLIEQTERLGHPWWEVRFSQTAGPLPSFDKFTDMEDQFGAVGDQLLHWIRNEGVRPSDICVICMGDYARWRMTNQVKSILKPIGVEPVVVTSGAFVPDDRQVIVTTPHSFKGYDAEVVLIPSVEQFVSKGHPNARALYVAMTRARSILAIFGKMSKGEGERAILDALEACIDAQSELPVVETILSEDDEFDDVLQAIGSEQRKWLNRLRKAHRLIQEPMLGPDGSIMCEPLFWYESNGSRFACFPSGKPSQRVRNNLEDAGVQILVPTESSQPNQDE